MKIKDIHDYHDIIDEPYVKSLKHPNMSQVDRSAQFAPFAALTGHKEAVIETGRKVDTKKELDEHKKSFINETLQQILRVIQHRPLITVVHFVKDEIKEGGSYVTITKHIKRIDEVYRMLIFVDASVILIDDVYDVEICEGL